MSALRGLIVGIVGLSAMQALVSTQAATANATGAIGAAGNVLSRWLDPTVALIPDLRGTGGGGTVSILPVGSSSPGSSSGGGNKYSGAGGSAQVNGWIAEANRVLLANGVRPDQLDDEALRVIIDHESSGNPTVVNRTDSNWLAGHPSKGLMQTIDSTFQENALPGWNTNVFDPVSNIIAGVRYALARYGSLSNVPGIRSLRAGGQYKGY